MNKLTLSIADKEKIAWAKAFAKSNNTSLSRLFENYLNLLEEFDKKEVILGSAFRQLRDPGKRPSLVEIEKHLKQRRSRSTSEKQGK